MKIARSLMFLASYLLATSCSPNENEPNPAGPFAEGEFYLSYGIGGPNADGDPVSICAFTGPHETLSLVEISGPPSEVLTDTSCQTQDPYQQSHWVVPAQVLRVAHGVELKSLQVVYYGNDISNTSMRDAEKGQRELWSIRNDGGEWFLLRRWEVEASGDPYPVTTSARIELPSRWSDIVTETADVRSSRATSCADEPEWHDGVHIMSDSEFSQWVRTPLSHGENCSGGNASTPPATNTSGEQAD